MFILDSFNITIYVSINYSCRSKNGKAGCINIYTKHKSQNIIDMDINGAISIILNMPMACDRIF